jgi:hypothetical protein
MNKTLTTHRQRIWKEYNNALKERTSLQFWLSRETQVATLEDKAEETVQVVTDNRHHYLPSAKTLSMSPLEPFCQSKALEHFQPSQPPSCSPRLNLFSLKPSAPLSSNRFKSYPFPSHLILPHS